MLAVAIDAMPVLEVVALCTTQPALQQRRPPQMRVLAVMLERGVLPNIELRILLVVLHCASQPVYIEYKSLEGQGTSGYI
jgi:hypothetical protein